MGNINSILSKTEKKTIDEASIEHRRNLGCFTIVWLDANENEINDDNLNTKTKLANVVVNIKTFNNSRQCIDFLSSIDENQKVFLIVSGQLGEHIVPEIHHFPQIELIYVFCLNISKHRIWANEYKKVAGVFNDISSICDKLKNDTFSSTNDLLPFSILDKNDTNKLDPSFMWFQLLIHILLHMSRTDEAIHEMIDECLKKYTDDEEQLKIIDEFKNTYSPENAIWWYTRECFFVWNVEQCIKNARHRYSI
ncbi:unnamed protein product [Rotaria sp. Silwood2]|nr:unnamed protein product [Rotaria sp. Silwood2]